MNFFKKIRLTVRYYKSLGRPEKAQKTPDLKIRPDAVAFLTCPYPVLPEEQRKGDQGKRVSDTKFWQSIKR